MTGPIYFLLSLKAIVLGPTVFNGEIVVDYVFVRYGIGVAGSSVHGAATAKVPSKRRLQRQGAVSNDDMAVFDVVRMQVSDATAMLRA